MTISKERQEIARRLRDYAGENAEWIAPWAVFHDWNGNNSTLLTNHLADLIDPVCKPVHSNTAMPDELVCSECGALIAIETNCTPGLLPNYCACCGARVVNTDE